MKWIAPLLLATAACAPVAPVAPIADPRRDAAEPRFDAAKVRADLIATARQRFGDAATDRALAAPVHLLAKHYYGLAPPPIVQPDGSYKYPDPPMALLRREKDGLWYAATAAGWRLAKPDKAAEIEALLADPAWRAEPVWAQPSCTDAGGSLLLAKPPGGAETVRQGACGAAERTERLVFLALDS